MAGGGVLPADAAPADHLPVPKLCHSPQVVTEIASKRSHSLMFWQITAWALSTFGVGGGFLQFYKSVVLRTQTFGGETRLWRTTPVI